LPLVFFAENREQLRGALSPPPTPPPACRFDAEMPSWSCPWTPRRPPLSFSISLAHSLSLSPAFSRRQPSSAVAFRRRSAPPPAPPTSPESSPMPSSSLPYEESSQVTRNRWRRRRFPRRFRGPPLPNSLPAILLRPNRAHRRPPGELLVLVDPSPALPRARRVAVIGVWAAYWPSGQLARSLLTWPARPTDLDPRSTDQ
jgi:hypothetical protein